jgi:hypothetical protein
VTFTVMPDGSLRGVETHSTSLGESVTSCVSRQFSKIVLEEGVVTDAVEVRYPMVFSPGETGLVCRSTEWLADSTERSQPLEGPPAGARRTRAMAAPPLGAR